MRHPLAFGPVMLAALAAFQPALGAPQIGVASAVLPAARGTPPAEPTRVLQVGLDMQANERVQTDAGGKAQLVFLDGSALSVGPNSDLVLDEYVYDPATQTGKIALSTTRGVFRLVGGKISKTTPVTLRTPSATIGVRGGIAMASVGETVTASFLFGDEMTVAGGGETQRVTRPGFRIVTGPDGAPQPPAPIPQQTLSGDLDAFEGGGEQPPGAPAVSDEDVANTQIALVNSGPAALDVAPAAGGESPPPPAPPAEDEARDASRIEPRTQSVPDDDEQPSDGGSPGDGGGAPPPPTLTGDFVGRAKHATNPAAGTDDASATNNVALTGGSVANGTFSAQAGAQLFTINAANGGFAATSTQQPFGTGVLAGGGFFTAEQDFLLYTLMDQADGHKVLAFAGVPSPPANVPATGVWRYQLLDDFVRAQTLPFIQDPAGLVSLPQLYVNWDRSAPSAERTFGAAAIAINGQGAAQQSAGVVLTGLVLDDAAGLPFMTGRAFGQRRLGANAASEPSVFYRAPVATSDAGGGADFFGVDAPRNFVLEAAQVDSADQASLLGGRIFSNAADTVGAPYFPNTPAIGGAPFAVGGRTTRTLNGFAAALESRYDSGGAFIDTQRLASISPAGVTISTDAAQNRVSAVFQLNADSDEASVQIAFGATTPDGDAFIDDTRFMALNDGTVTVDSQSAPGFMALATSSELQHDGFLPAGVSFCQCDYLVWGFFAGVRDRSSLTPTKRVAELGAWVAGEMSDISQIVGIAPQSATYSGHVIAGVHNAGAIYQAVGGISLNFTFGAGNFALNSVNITNFDGTNLSGVNTAGPEFGGNSFDSLSFQISGTHPTAGAVAATVRGALFGPGSPPVNAGGAVRIFNGNSYDANGIFATQRPPS